MSSISLVLHWKAVTTPYPFAGGPTKLRLEVTQPDGRVRLLAPAFETKAGLDRYVARFLPHLAGKESPERSDEKQELEARTESGTS
ncbi:MAG: hypothetical protein NTY38_22790 [Acidobacteria bacterium]|nr:hypothetical protein [Acidobacteriota bacterium]